MVLYVKIIKKLKERGKREKKISISIYRNKQIENSEVIKHIYHLIKLRRVMNFFKNIRFKMSFSLTFGVARRMKRGLYSDGQEASEAFFF